MTHGGKLHDSWPQSSTIGYDHGMTLHLTPLKRLPNNNVVMDQATLIHWMFHPSTHPGLLRMH